MARTRNLKPGFFKNDILVVKSMAARLLFAGLWTIADREGRLEDRPMKIKFEVFPGDSVDIDALLDELNGGFITRYSVGKNKYIQILKFKEHQNPHQKEPASSIPAPDMSETGTGHVPVEPCLLPSPNHLVPSPRVEASCDAQIPEKIKHENKKGTRLPNDWKLPDEWGDWAMTYCASKGLFDGKPFVIEQGVVFKNYWTAKTAQATKLDWKGTWENWIRRGLPDYQLKQKRMEREKSYEQIRRK